MNINTSKILNQLNHIILTYHSANNFSSKKILNIEYYDFKCKNKKYTNRWKNVNTILWVQNFSITMYTSKTLIQSYFCSQINIDSITTVFEMIVTAIDETTRIMT